MMGHSIIEAIVRAIADGRADEARGAANALDAVLVPALFQRLDLPIEVSAGADDPRSFFESIHDVAHAAAHAQPDAFVSGLRSGTIRRNHLTVCVLAGLGRMDSADILVDALESTSWLERKEGIQGLEAPGAGEALKPHLARLLGDSDTSVSFSAVRAMVRWGEPDDIPRLQAFRATASRGASEIALDAIEVICDRAHLPLPDGHPRPRIETVRLTLGNVVTVARTLALVSPPQQVREGQPLVRLTSTRGDEHAIEAPCDGILLRLDLDLAEAVIERRPRQLAKMRSR